MPGSKLNKDDIFDPSFFQALTKADKELKELLITFNKLAKSAKEISKGVSAAKSFNEVSKAAKKASESTKKLTAEEKKLERATKALAFEQSKAGQEFAKINEAKKLAAKRNRDLAKAQDTTRKSTNKWGVAVKSFAFKFNALGNIVANFASVALRKLKQGFIATFNIVAKFDQAMADVKAVTGASKKEIDALTKSAQKLGGTTKFTATQVAQLQKEYAKLGLTTKEILNAQAATLDLAAATNTELPRAAEVVGITLKQFKLGAEEATRVTDVMAKSFTTSALDMEKFAEAMKFVGPAARVSGISIERTTAMLGQLADAGISGSMAGTSLRQIMLALSKETGTFAEKMERAAAKGLDLAGASEEVQKRAATSLIVLADGVDTIDDYTESLENAAGASQDMADIQLDTLQGKITLVKSAWEGMILAMLNTEENLSGVKWALSGIVDLLNAMALRAETGLKLSEAWAIEKATDDLAEWAIELDKSNKSLDEFVGFFEKGTIKDAFKGFGKDLIDELFPKPEAVVEVFEDVSKQLKAIKKDQADSFKEEDQEYSGSFHEMWNEVERQSEGGFDALLALNKANQESELDLMRETTDEQEKELQRRLDLERWVAEETKNLKIDTANEAFNFISAINDQRLAKVQRDLDNEVISEEEAEKKKRKIQKQSAVIEKAQALFNIAINAAEGIVKYGSNPLTAPLIPFIIGLAAAQAAVVVATPIPAFAKGTDSAPGGPSVVGEKGSELMIGPDGKIGLTPDSATLMDIDKGTKIFPSDITRELLGYTAIATAMGGNKDERVILAVMQKIDQSNNRLYRAIKDKPVSSSSLTPAGIRTMLYKGNTVIKRTDKYFK